MRLSALRARVLLRQSSKQRSVKLKCEPVIAGIDNSSHISRQANQHRQAVNQIDDLVRATSAMFAIDSNCATGIQQDKNGFTRLDQSIIGLSLCYAICRSIVAFSDANGALLVYDIT